MKKSKVSNKNKTKKENILDEIAVSLQSIKDDKSEEETNLPESGLEEDVELNLKELEFQQFMQPSENVKAPVLERIAGSSPRTIFVGTGSQSSQTFAEEEENNDKFKYIPGQAKDEPKYLGSDSTISAEPRQLNIIEAGRKNEIIPDINQEAFFQGASEIKNFQSQNVERFERVDRFDAERARRRDSSEKEEAKYEKYKPKMPKSY
ncbi:MAG: hypothetical protein ABIH65_01520 [Nanoarchaeota archaeon]